MVFGAVFASASAINADFFGAEKLPVMLGGHGELPILFTQKVSGRAVYSLISIAILALLAVNLIGLHPLSAATSGGFLIVYAVVNFANARLSRETNSREWISILASLACVVALAVMLVQFAANRDIRPSSYAFLVIAVLAMIIELFSRLLSRGPAASVVN
jgi:L-asparagine transporter-like permease